MGNFCSGITNRILSVMCMGCCGHKLAEADSEEIVTLTKSLHNNGERSDCHCHRSRCSTPFPEHIMNLKDWLLRKKPKTEDGCFEAIHFFDGEPSSTSPPPPLLRTDPNAPWRSTFSNTNLPPPTPCRPYTRPCTCCLRTYPLRGRRSDCAPTCEATCGDGTWTKESVMGSDEELLKAAETHGGWTSVTQVGAGKPGRLHNRPNRPQESKQYNKLKGTEKRRVQNKSGVDYGCHCNVSRHPVVEEIRNRTEKQQQSNKSNIADERKGPNFIEAPVQSSVPNFDDACKCKTPSISATDQECKNVNNSNTPEERRQSNQSKIVGRSESKKSNLIQERRPSTMKATDESLQGSVGSAFNEERRQSNKLNTDEKQRLSKTSSVNKSFVDDGCRCPTPKRSVDSGRVLCEKPVVKVSKSSKISNNSGELKPSSKDILAEDHRSSLVSGMVVGRKRTSRQAAVGIE